MTVTKQQQLEHIAKECHSWSGRDFILASDTELGYRLPVSSGCYLITRTEWQQERDRMQKRKEYEERAVMGNPKVAQAIIDAHNALKDLPHASVIMDAWNKGANEFMDSLQNRIDINPIGGKPFSVATEQIHPVNPETLERNIEAMKALGATLVTPHKSDSSWHERGELPPVGCECEWVDESGVDGPAGSLYPCVGDTVSVCAHRQTPSGNVIAIFTWAPGDGGLRVAASRMPEDFRPLRTEREKAIDALIEIICAGGELSRDGSAAREIAERLYDAGMLK